MSLDGHPKDLESFYLKHPSFVWGPALVAGSFTLLTKLPRVAAHFEQMGSTPYGVQWSAAYALYGIVLCFATHGWYCTFVEQDRQLQSYNPKGSAKDAAQLSYAERPQPRAGAVRSMATFATSLVYTVVPLAPATTSWAAFAAWTCALAVYWDLHFFCVHAFAHENRHAYKFLHKLHHIYKQPDVYSAYFVTYQSHFCTEQAVILIAAAAGLPVDVFTWTLWFGTLDSFIKHGGHSISSKRLPFLPFSWEFLATCLSPWSLVFGGATTAEHDWHHEKFTTNYALSFTYLDKLLGKYHAGRKAGEAVKPAPLPPKEPAPVAPEPAKSATAMYTNLSESTSEDWRVQGAAFDKYKSEGKIVSNVLDLVKKMKGELGEIGARVDMYEHSLQTATRARRAGADTETIVCALLHDIGVVLSSSTHCEIAASLLRPYITPKNHWMLSQHEVFQAYYFLDKRGGDKDLRDKVKEYTSQGYIKGHPFYEATVQFCDQYVQPSFDPSYDTDKLESFVPLVEEVFNRKPFWWEPEDKPLDELDCKARLASSYAPLYAACGEPTPSTASALEQDA